MKTRPILFSAPMVRAILDARKTQTRRIAKRNDAGRVRLAHREWHVDDPNASLACPYGQPGDRLWVREAWAEISCFGLPPNLIVYREGDARTTYGGPWKPSIHMPRRASRITLAIDSVRLERLHNISEGDAIAEGVELAYPTTEATWYRDYLRPETDHYCGGLMPSAVDSYETLWKSINGDDSYNANPIVWVVEFHRIDKETGNV